MRISALQKNVIQESVAAELGPGGPCVSVRVPGRRHKTGG